MIERKIDGRKAEITNELKEFSTYTSFAIKHGYPDAAVKGDDVDKRKPLEGGDVVTLLVSGEHEWASYGVIWIVEAENGERHLIGEDGLRIIDAGVTVLPDESLGGVLREYREVKRNANVGERIRNLRARTDYPEGHVAEVLRTSHDGNAVTKDLVGFTRYSGESSYVVLEPTNIVHIDGARFHMLDRKAAVGERVIVVNEGRESSGGRYYRIGNVGVMLGEGYAHGNIRADFTGNDEYRGDGRWSVSPGDYRVLEPVKDEAETATQPLSSRPATLLSSRSSAEQAAENVAALTAKIQALETRLNALYDWHKRAAIDLRVAREDIVLIEEGVSDDIDTLKSRVAALEKEQINTPKLAVTPPQKTAQQIRDEIVEQAKFDVRSKTVCRDVEFVVNRDKRTVVALVRGLISGKIVARGIAKCAPNDVFNAHIGRAIALRRALGLEVPAEYLSVPNPTEVRVGDVVVWVTQGSIGGRVTAVDATGKAHVDVNWMTWVLVPSALKITDDTREGEFTSFAVKGVVA